MLNTFMYMEKGLWHWYVLNGSHVLDQGIAKTANTAEKRANTSKMIIAFQLDGVWV